MGMYLPASDKQSSFKRPHIKKGYYPAQLLRVVPYNDKDNKPIEGKFGRQLIFEYGIYKPNQDTGVPIEPMMWADETMKEKQEVILAKFVYYMYKDQKTGDLRTAITPNSAITKILKAHGWVFTPEGVDVEKLLKTWVEVNIDDYENEGSETEKPYIASTIKDIGPYKGPEIPKDMKLIVPREPKEVKKETSQKELERRKDAGAFGPDLEAANNADVAVAKIKAKMTEIEDLKEKGFLTPAGYDTAMGKLKEELAKFKGK